MAGSSKRADRVAKGSLSLSKRRATMAAAWRADGTGEGVKAATVLPFKRYNHYLSERIASDAVPMPCDSKPEQLRLF